MKTKTLALFVVATLFAALGVKAHNRERETKDQIITFDVGSSQVTRAASINPRGEITGWYQAANGTTQAHGFLRAADGTITSFDVPSAGLGGTFPTSINSKGQITGWFYDASYLVHGFVRATDGTFTTFDVPPPNSTQPFSINDKGEVAGWNTPPPGSMVRGFVRGADGTITTFYLLDDTGAPSPTFPESINPHGVITGAYFDNLSNIYSPTESGFIRARDGTMITFKGPGAGSTSSPVGINPRGEITGWHGNASGLHGFLRAPDGTITLFDAGSEGTAPASINPSGEVTGIYGDASGVHGFVRTADGDITSFDAGPHYTNPVSINSKGECTGWFYDASYTVIHSFLRKPDLHEGAKDEKDDEGGEDSKRPE